MARADILAARAAKILARDGPPKKPDLEPKMTREEGYALKKKLIAAQAKIKKLEAKK